MSSQGSRRKLASAIAVTAVGMLFAAPAASAALVVTPHARDASTHANLTGPNEIGTSYKAGDAVTGSTGEGGTYGVQVYSNDALCVGPHFTDLFAGDDPAPNPDFIGLTRVASEVG